MVQEDGTDREQRDDALHFYDGVVKDAAVSNKLAGRDIAKTGTMFDVIGMQRR